MPILDPIFITSRANINIVYYKGAYWTVPQQLGRVFLDEPQTQLMQGVEPYTSKQQAIATVTWRNIVMWPIWRLSVLLRDIAFAIVRWAPPVRQPEKK